MEIPEKCLNEIIFDGKNLKFWLKTFKIEHESDIVQLYSSVGSKWLNDYLKQKRSDCNCQNFIIKTINSQLKKQKKYSNRIVFRMDDYFEDNFLKWNLKKTNIIELPYFLSTSKENWNNKKYIIKIKTSRQSKGIDLLNFGIDTSDMEVLFPLNSKFEIKSIINNFIELEEIN
tara:strand:- start:1605 stop:2123 length:519 start_codon:yes stop_codon:yes gene_type:complete